MTCRNRQIIVIGAGIGGLTVARALALWGAQVTVLEQAPAITEVGAGIQVSPNGTAVLRAIGVEAALRETGAPISRALTLRDKTGRRIARFPYAGLQRPDDYLFVYRADLIDVLAAAARAAGVDIRLGASVDHLEQDEHPEVHLRNGETLTAEVVVGADGLHSVARTAVLPRSEPFFTRQVAWRCVVPGDDGPNEAELYMAPGRHIVTYPLCGGRLRNIVAVEERSDWIHESWSRRDSADALRAAFQTMGPRPRALLDRAEKVNIWGLFRHPVAPQWHSGQVVLLGDAVHPTLPFLAQGACLAMEDAWVLAQKLDETDDWQTAFHAYQSARKARVTKTVDRATGNARNFHMGGPLALGAQLGLGMAGIVLPSLITRSFAWLYDHDVTGGEVLSPQISSSTQTGT